MVGVKNIIIKELTRVFKDKKLIFSLFILPAVMMFVMYSLMGQLLNNFMEDIKEHVPTIYIQNAPEYIDDIIKEIKFEGNIEYVEINKDIDDLKNKVLLGEIDLIVVFEDNFLQYIKDYKVEGDYIPEIKTYYNPAEEYSTMARSSFMSTVITAYEQSILANRLDNMELLHVFNVDNDQSTSIIINEKKADGKTLAMLLPFLVNILLFSGSMGLVVDSITGEKERGTLASMLLAPIKRQEIVIGKLVSLGILSIMSAVMYLISIIISIPLMMKGIEGEGNIFGGLATHFSALDILQLFLIMIFIVYFYVAIITLVSIIAKNSKEANTYVMPAYILVMIGSIMTMYSTGSDKALKLYAIPVYNSSICMQNILMGELTLPKFLVTILSIALCGGILTFLITKAFNSEKIMFNA